MTDLKHINKHRFGIYYFSLAILIFTTQCKKSKQTDPSLTIEEYQEIGVPDPNSIWSLNDYSQAFSVLYKLKLNRPLALPMRGSEKSGLLYSRMTSLDNLSFLKEEKPLNQKAQQIKMFQNVYYDMVDLYTNLLMKKQHYHRELMGANLYGLALSHKMLALAKKINQSKVPGDISMRSGYESILGIYTNHLNHLFQSQNDTAMYSIQDLEILSDSVVHSIEKNWTDLDSVRLNYIMTDMQAIADSTHIEHVQQNYTQLVTSLAGQQ